MEHGGRIVSFIELSNSFQTRKQVFGPVFFVQKDKSGSLCGGFQFEFPLFGADRTCSTCPKTNALEPLQTLELAIGVKVNTWPE